MECSLPCVELFRKPQLLLTGYEMCFSFSCNVFRKKRFKPINSLSNYVPFIFKMQAEKQIGLLLEEKFFQFCSILKNIGIYRQFCDKLYFTSQTSGLVIIKLAVLELLRWTEKHNQKIGAFLQICLAKTPHHKLEIPQINEALHLSDIWLTPPPLLRLQKVISKSGHLQFENLQIFLSSLRTLEGYGLY